MDDQANEVELERLEHIVSDASAEPIKISYELMRSITNNFSDEIGRGGFGVVYKGVLGNGDVAVKKLSNLHALSDQQFLDEISCLKNAKHKNIVRFIGYCSEKHEELRESDGANIMAEELNKLICIEYVPGGNIEHYLQRENPHGEGWLERYNMIQGICQGLKCLHDQQIIHLDLKPENIMLDANMDPKITDFGLSRCLDQGQSKLITQHIIGTRRYIAPEVTEKGEISFKSDIYSLGIIIIELITGISRIGLEKWDESLDMLDCPRMRKCTEIAENCTQRDKHNRPTVHEVISELEDLERMMIPNSSPIYQQVTRSAFPGTDDLIDVYPLEPTFHLNQDNDVNGPKMHSDLALINRHTDRGLFYLIVPEVPYKFGGEYAQFVEPKTTKVITLYRRPKFANRKDKLEVLVLLTTVTDVNTFYEQVISACSDDPGRSMEHFCREDHDLLGYQLYRTTLTAVFTKFIDKHVMKAYSKVEDIADQVEGIFEKASNCIASLDVHPTEPWVLLVQDRSTTLIICNCETGKLIRAVDILGTDETALTVKIIGRKQWVLVGDAYGYIHVATCPGMREVSLFNAHNGAVSLLEVHPTRPFLLSYTSSTTTSTMKLWCWNGGWSCRGVFDITDTVTQVMFNPGHTSTFTTHSDSGLIKMWNFDLPDPIAATKTVRKAVSGQYLPVSGQCHRLFTYTGNHNLIAIFEEPFVRIMDMQNKELVHLINYTEDSNEKIVAVVYHPTCPIFVTASASGDIRVWDSTAYRLKKRYYNMPENPIHVGFTGSRRLVIGYPAGIMLLKIDLE